MANEQVSDEDEQKLEEQVDRMMSGRPGEQPTENGPSSAPELTDQEVGPTEEPLADQVEDSTDQMETDEPVTQPVKASELDDEKTGEAIDEINRRDSDAVLAAEDEKSAGESDTPPPEPNLFKRWWGSKPWRYGSLLILVGLIIAAFVVPVSRWWILEHSGLRGNVSVTVLDGSTGLPLPGASVDVAGQTKLSGTTGKVDFDGVKLGRQKISIRKPAFAAASRNATVTFGNNNLGQIALKAVGIQYKVKLRDYLTGQPVVAAEVSSGRASALSDTGGLAVLTLMGAPKSVSVQIKASGYNSSTVTVSGQNRQADAALTPAGKDYFISQASGTYDVDSANLDGSNPQLVLKGTGLENGDIQLAADAGGDLLALVSIRDNQRGPDGYNLESLTIINLQTGNKLTLDHAKAFHLIGWLDGDTLVYVSDNQCNGQPCSSLMSYAYAKGARKQLANAGSFAAVTTIGDRIYYATGSNYQSTAKPELVALNSDGTSQQTLLQNDIYSVYRPDYSHLLIAALGDWYSYQAGGSQATSISPPSNPELRYYVDGPSGQKSAWIDQRNGQPVLMVYNKQTNQDKTVASLPGLSYPIRWLNQSTLVFRVNSPTETADYVLSLAGGQPKKITNVTNASGAGGLYY